MTHVSVQVQGIHHITLNGTDRQTSVDFWEGVLGMPLIFEQPNLDAPEINHLYFDTGDGRTLTVFTEEGRQPPSQPLAQQPGSVHHIAFWVAQATIRLADERLKARGYGSSGVKDRGFMDSLYFRDPMGLLVELASYKFDPPQGKTHGDVLNLAHKIRLERDGLAIETADVADALARLSER
ncbi:VOC family protein [Neptunicoccus sediminis]|uniref:VOC family protein n=1 Tax=Neptunicoccus sediminis TaxID=1892596 RepID=UPI000845C402|nr:VOC family protein [Neptunicoccus sediminis]